MIEKERVKIINFLQDFGCCKLKHLQILFNKPNDNFQDILVDRLVSKKDDIYVHKTYKINKKMISALDILCKYKPKLFRYKKGVDPVYITFITKDNTLYNIVITDKENELGIVKLLNYSSPLIPEADKYILLFKDEECFSKIDIKIPYVYCIYPELCIMNTINAWF